MLYLESPIGTGFSYNTHKLDLVNDDSTTAASNFAALRAFYVKFPHLANNEFFITGESYAGRYIPQLASLILDANFPTNFVGVAIGNGYLNTTASPEEYMYSHGFNSRAGLNPYNILANCKIFVR